MEVSMKPCVIKQLEAVGGSTASLGPAFRALSFRRPESRERGSKRQQTAHYWHSLSSASLRLELGSLAFCPVP